MRCTRTALHTLHINTSQSGCKLQRVESIYNSAESWRQSPSSKSLISLVKFIMLLLRLVIRTAPAKCPIRQLFCLFCCLLVFCSLSFLGLMFSLRPNLNDFFLLPSRLELTAMAEKIQTARRNSIEEKCQQQVKSADNATRRIHSGPVQFRIEERHRIMYCDVPKVFNYYTS